jgi:hypothetical protein
MSFIKSCVRSLIITINNNVSDLITAFNLWYVLNVWWVTSSFKYGYFTMLISNVFPMQAVQHHSNPEAELHIVVGL